MGDQESSKMEDGMGPTPAAQLPNRSMRRFSFKNTAASLITVRQPSKQGNFIGLAIKALMRGLCMFAGSDWESQPRRHDMELLAGYKRDMKELERELRSLESSLRVLENSISTAEGAILEVMDVIDKVVEMEHGSTVSQSLARSIEDVKQYLETIQPQCRSQSLARFYGTTNHELHKFIESFVTISHAEKAADVAARGLRAAEPPRFLPSSNNKPAEIKQSRVRRDIKNRSKEYEAASAYLMEEMTRLIENKSQWIREVADHFLTMEAEYQAGIVAELEGWTQHIYVGEPRSDQIATLNISSAPLASAHTSRRIESRLSLNSDGGRLWGVIRRVSTAFGEVVLSNQQDDEQMSEFRSALQRLSRLVTLGRDIVTKLNAVESLMDHQSFAYSRVATSFGTLLRTDQSHEGTTMRKALELFAREESVLASSTWMSVKKVAETAVNELSIEIKQAELELATLGQDHVQVIRAAIQDRDQLLAAQKQYEQQKRNTEETAIATSPDSDGDTGSQARASTARDDQSQTSSRKRGTESKLISQADLDKAEARIASAQQAYSQACAALGERLQFSACRERFLSSVVSGLHAAAKEYHQRMKLLVAPLTTSASRSKIKLKGNADFDGRLASSSLSQSTNRLDKTSAAHQQASDPAPEPLQQPLASSAQQGLQPVAEKPASVLTPFQTLKAPAKSYSIVVVGETGSGKSTLLNACCNFFREGSLENLRILIPTKTPSNATERDSPLNVEGDPNNQTAAQTQKTTSYRFEVKEKTITIIDTPGLADTRGTKQDDNNMDMIIRACTQATNLQAIVFVFNGTQARFTLTMQTVIARFKNSLPDAVLSNIVVVFTNTTKLECNLTPEMFETKFLQGKKLEKYVYMQNSTFKSETVDKLSDFDTRQKLLGDPETRSELEIPWRRSMDALAELFSRTNTLASVSGDYFAEMQAKRDEIKSKMAGLLTEIAMMEKTRQKIVAAETMRIKAGLDQSAYKNYISNDMVEKWTQVPTSYHNTLCTVHKHEEPCHHQCGLQMASGTGSEELSGCYAFNGTDICQTACSGQNCSRVHHYHAMNVWRRDVKPVAKILADIKSKYDDAKAMGERAMQDATSAEQAIQELDDILHDRVKDIQQLCIDLKGICTAFNIAAELDTNIQAWETELMSIQDMTTRKALKARITTMQQFIDSLNGKTVFSLNGKQKAHTKSHVPLTSGIDVGEAETDHLRSGSHHHRSIEQGHKQRPDSGQQQLEPNQYALEPVPEVTKPAVANNKKFARNPPKKATRRGKSHYPAAQTI